MLLYFVQNVFFKSKIILLCVIIAIQHSSSSKTSARKTQLAKQNRSRKRSLRKTRCRKFPVKLVLSNNKKIPNKDIKNTIYLLVLISRFYLSLWFGYLWDTQWRSQDFLMGEAKLFEQHSPGAVVTTSSSSHNKDIEVCQYLMKNFQRWIGVYFFGRQQHA